MVAPRLNEIIGWCCFGKTWCCILVNIWYVNVLIKRKVENNNFDDLFPDVKNEIENFKKWYFENKIPINTDQTKVWTSM